MIKLKNLKYFVALACFILSVVNNTSYSQNKKESDLKVMVDDIIFNHLKCKPTPDSLIIKIKNSKAYDTVEYRLTPNTYPLIILNGVPINYVGDTSLNKFSLKDVYYMTVVLKDETVSNMYGTRSANGLIIISTESSTNQKISKKKRKHNKINK